MTYEPRNLSDAEIDAVGGGFLLALTLLRACISVAHAPTGDGGGTEDDPGATDDTGGNDDSTEDDDTGK
jgi:hypothetical protein